MTITTIVSGGQTGVDRAALDVALALEIPCKGWCPAGRKAEDGRIPDRYPMTETSTWKYSVRTRWNVRDSDGTLILSIGKLTGGTALTEAAARQQNKPCFVVDLSEDWNTQSVLQWIDDESLETLNVAGPRESQKPGIHDQAEQYLKQLLEL